MPDPIPLPGNIANLRREYTTSGLRKEDLSPNPFDQFRQWFREAQAAGLLEPNAMSLATAGANGAVTARTVLLKAFDERGLVFFTNYESVKARQLAENPRAALLFPWLALERQVTISGPVEKISTVESLAYFASRPFGSRLGAWISQQSRVIPSRKLLELKFEEMRRKFANGEVPLPSFWGGYRVAPETIEFWQGAASRLHDRFQYSRDPRGEWVIERLSP
ncbi:MAG: pyridoxamine 5'-phosphate oxidase [Verrucomicrobiales bacterium]|jgi:pyridoxamine 5'-phosphate oxidase|nr:pyridoxamine 5'-phosphate oxidase [Verrucomicrobiales bacterium]